MAKAEETLVEEVEGVLINATGTALAEQGRGLRKKCHNKMYTFWIVSDAPQAVPETPKNRNIYFCK